MSSDEHFANRAELTKVLKAAFDGDVVKLKRLVDGAVSNGISSSEAVNGFKDGNGRSPVFFAAFGGHTHALKYLVQEGADINAVDSEGEPPLMAACRKGFVETAQFLIQSEADVSIRSKVGATSLHHAVNWGDVSLVELLIDAKAALEVQSDLGTALQWAVAHGQQDVSVLLLSRGANGEPPPIAGFPPPIVMAAAMNHTGVVTALIDANVDNNAVDDNGFTALMNAAENGFIDIVKKLLLAGADVNAVNKAGNTALDVAVANSHGDAVELLLPMTMHPQCPVVQVSHAAVEETGAAPSAEDKAAAQAVKAEGNDMFRNGDYKAAIECYKRAHDFDVTNAPICGNLAACFLKLDMNEAALAAAQDAIRADPSWTKGKFREGEAFCALGLHGDAAASFWECVHADPCNEQARIRFEEELELGKAEHAAKMAAARN